MSEQTPKILVDELRAMLAAVRGEPADALLFATLLGVSRPAAEKLLSRGTHSRALAWLVLLLLVGRLRQVPIQSVSRDDVSRAIHVSHLLTRREITRPAQDLTTDELAAASAVLRRQRPDTKALAQFLGESLSVTQGLLYISALPLDDVIVARLALRLHGLQVEPSALLDAVREVLEWQMQQLRELMH